MTSAVLADQAISLVITLVFQTAHLSSSIVFLLERGVVSVCAENSIRVLLPDSEAWLHPIGRLLSPAELPSLA